MLRSHRRDQIQTYKAKHDIEDYLSRSIRRYLDAIQTGEFNHIVYSAGIQTHNFSNMTPRAQPLNLQLMLKDNFLRKSEQSRFLLKPKQQEQTILKAINSFIVQFCRKIALFSYFNAGLDIWTNFFQFPYFEEIQISSKKFYNINYWAPAFSKQFRMTSISLTQDEDANVASLPKKVDAFLRYINDLYFDGQGPIL